MKKKGRFSLFIAILLLLAGLALAGLGILGSMNILPEAYSSALSLVSFYSSISAGINGPVESASLVLLISLVIFAFRNRKPFSMFLPFFIIIIYCTGMVVYRLNNGIDVPAFLASYANPAKSKLIGVLLVLEIILTFVLLSITSSMDSRWRKKRDLMRRKLEMDGVIPTKEEEEAMKIKKKLEKDLRAQEKKDAKQRERFERERERQESAEKRRISKAKDREDRRYERVREKEERAREAVEEKSRNKARKALDKEEERAKGKVRKLEKASRREEKRRAKKERERLVLEEKQDSKSVFTAPANPNSPLTFPDFIDMPELKTFKDAYQEEPAQEKPRREESAAILETLKEEIIEEAPIYEDITEKKRFRSGGMVEATLEMMNAPQLEVERPTSPIKGYEDYESPRNRKEPSSFAPSSLSPDHPRYKMFEALKETPAAPRMAAREEEPRRKSDLAPSSLSPEHPRYKMFEALKEAPASPRMNQREEEPRRRSDLAPSSLSPDHPRYKMFESLQKPAAAERAPVSHYPSRSFEPEERSYPDAQMQMGTYRRAPEPATKYEEPYAPPQNEYELRPAESVRPQEMPRPMQEPQRPSYNPPEREIYTPDYNDLPEQRTSLDMTAGIGGLVSNNAGYAAIMNRQRRLYTAPPLTILKDYPELSGDIDEATRRRGEIIVDTYAQQRIQVELDNIIKGPTVTMFELKLAPGVLISKVTARESELNYALGGKHVRIIAPIPGKQAVGIEVPNDRTSIVGFKDMIYSMRASEKAMKHKVPMILGKTITGEPVVIDVAKMPHMIIAGTTGSGKSVCINAFINTLIYQKGPSDVRLILVDPKVVELVLYNGIPHLLTPVITEAKKVVKVLNFLVEEMERRYSMLSNCGVRNIEGYNQRIKDQNLACEKMPYIVLIMDEFADMMAVVGKDIETQIARLAAKARAAGIHMILATQRPSSDVITGTIKSNLPARVAFAVSSSINSRVILDEGGAENLLGKGDMLLLDPGVNGLQRIQGAFLSDQEVEEITGFARSSGGEPDYLDDVIFEDFDDKKNDFDDDDEASAFLDDDSDEALYEKAKEIVFERKSASASYLQRRMKIGYNRAARLIEMMEERGVVGPAQGSKPREILKFE